MPKNCNEASKRTAFLGGCARNEITRRRLDRVSLDKMDLSPGLLRQRIYANLEKSEHLIVLCSPASAKAEWPDEEIRKIVERSSFVDIKQLRNLDDCHMNEQPGEQVIRSADYGKTTRKIRCSEVRHILVKNGYSKESIDRIMAELATRPAGWGVDAGVDAPDAPSLL